MVLDYTRLKGNRRPRSGLLVGPLRGPRKTNKNRTFNSSRQMALWHKKMQKEMVSNSNSSKQINKQILIVALGTKK